MSNISTRGDLLKYLDRIGSEFRHECADSIVRNSHLHNLKRKTKISQDMIDAVLVMFINHIGTDQNLDWALKVDHWNKIK